MSDPIQIIQNHTRILTSVAMTIHELKTVPSGTLYAQLMGHMSLETYQSLVDCMKNIGLIKETPEHLLVWIGENE